jgi:hypothetical protein
VNSIRTRALQWTGVPVVALILALALPSSAAAAEFKVNGTGDSGETPAKEACKTAVGECTLRAAIVDANVASDLDQITFGSTFNGGPGSTIGLGSGLSISQPVQILGSVIDEPGGPVPAATVQVSGGAISISNAATGTVVDGLGVNATAIGIQVLGAVGAKIRNNFVSGAQAAIEVNNVGGSTANVIEGNEVEVPANFDFGIVLQGGPNQIFGNEVKGSGCCYTGIWVEGSSSGNQIGGDTPESENVITGFSNGSIRVESTGNEVGRNRGSGGSEFLHTAGSTPAPTIVTAQQPKAIGTAQPGATVRVFATESEFLDEIEGFVGKATADGSGRWEVGLAGVPVGGLVTATQTLSGNTSGLSTTVAVTAEPPPSGGGGTGGGGEGTTTPTVPQTPTVTQTPPLTPAATPAPTAPKVKITKGPAKSSKATKATFRFSADVAGATFECRLDRGKWARCTSPRTYQKLKVGKHTFRVRAIASGLASAAAVFKFTVTA